MSLLLTFARSCVVRCPQPERAGLADPLEIGAALLAATRVPRRQIVGVEHVMARLRREEPGQLRETDEAFLRARLKGRPATRVLFRPEEVHARSQKRRPAPGRAEAVVEVP